MITATAQSFIKGAMQDLGVLALGQEPTGAEADDALIVLNLLADSLGVERLLLYSLVRTTKTLAATTASYTVGSGGDISIERPLWLSKAGLVMDVNATTPTETPIDVLTNDEYAEWPQKTQQNQYAMAVFYDHSWSAGLGRIYPLPIPNVSTTQLVLYTPGGHVSQFANLTTEYTFPPAYAMAIRRQLALHLAPMYPMVTPSPLLIQQGAAAKRMIKNANVRTPIYPSNPILSGRGGYFDLDSGTWR